MRNASPLTTLALALGILLLCTHTGWASAEPRRASSAPVRSPAPSLAAPPQYYIHFGKCGHELQQAAYLDWDMTRFASQQPADRGSLVLSLDTKNVSPVAAAFGTVDPPYFPIRYIYLAYFSNAGVAAWSPALDATGYTEKKSYYAFLVNGRPLSTVRDLKDRGVKTPETSVYSLKGTLAGLVTPSQEPYRVEVVKACSLSGNASLRATCASVPNPVDVFTSPAGYMVWSVWSVAQPLVVNGVPVKDHAWCPVKTVLEAL